MGKLTKQPLAELIREISIKDLSGTLRLNHDPVQTAVYFDGGRLIYAAANLRTVRLREYLLKHGLVSGQARTRLDSSLSDLDLAAALTAAGILRQKDIDALLGILVSDILRVALLWTEGTWEFDTRARLLDPVLVNLDIGTLLREAAQRMSSDYVMGRFRNPGELLTRTPAVARTTNLVPAESFILSRLDRPLTLSELVLVSGLPETEAYGVIYGLSLCDLIIREHWQNAFRGEIPKPGKEQIPASGTPLLTTQSEHSDNWVSASVESDELEEFLNRQKTATNHYEVLGLPISAKLSEIKEAYYAMARRYHPDRFHLKTGTKLHAQISSAFASVTQAYETLANPNIRAGYDHTLERARQFAAAEAKANNAEQAAGAAEAAAEREFDEDGSETGLGPAEYSFREGCGAFDQGRINAAITHLANAARLDPQEARYRAHYGHALAANHSTRRLAESELQAAIGLDPNNAAFRTMLAEFYYELKFHRRAQTELDRALSIDPNNVMANMLLRKLEKTRKVG